MKQFLDRLATHTDSAEVFELNSTVNLVLFEHGRLKTLNTLNSHGAAVRAVSGGKMGQSIVSDFRSPDTAAARIRHLAELGDSADFSFTGKEKYLPLDLVDTTVNGMTVEQMIEMGREAAAVIRDYDPDVSMGFICERSRDRVRVTTTAGADTSYERLYLSYGVHAEFIGDQNILVISKYGKGIRPPKRPVDTARQVVDYLKIGRNTVPFKPGRLDVFFAPAAMADVMMAFTEAVDGANVAKRVSPLTGRLGDRILDPRVTILDDPWHAQGIMSCPCDDEGTPTQRKAIIQDGVLKHFITDRRSADALDQAPSGNGFRSVPFERYKSFDAAVSTEFSNLVMSPGDTSSDTIRKNIQLGIEIHQINGILLGDLIGGDFSGSLELAFLIQDGERIGRVKNAMIGGNFYSLFKNQLVNLSADPEWTGTFGGCSGAMLLPWVHAADVEISGTE